MEAQRNSMQLEASLQKEAMQLTKESVMHDSDKEHEKDIQARELMADALRNVFTTKTGS